jgi:uncharacterized membrane protein YphA (DoxX/SURF4 family)
MNGLVWIAQILLAFLFLYAGLVKLFAFRELVQTLESRTPVPIKMTRFQGKIIGILELAGAIGVIMPPFVTPGALGVDHLLIRLAAGGLGLLMVVAALYHLRRNESAAPAIAAGLLATFVIIGRWPS